MYHSVNHSEGGLAECVIQGFEAAPIGTPSAVACAVDHCQTASHFLISRGQGATCRSSTPSCRPTSEVDYWQTEMMLSTATQTQQHP